MADSSDEFEIGEDGNVEFSAALERRLPWLETPLKIGSNMIRILRLHKGSGQDPISCDLAVASLDERPIFESLSYVWGDPTQTKTIQIGGTAFEATRNLADFLFHLRLKDADRLLWADAICIDQSNEQEKDYQVRLMTRIYHQGSAAHIWFGAFTPSWIEEVCCEEEDFVRSSEMTNEQWEEEEETGRKELKFFIAAGGTPIDREQYLQARSTVWEDIFLEALDVLDTATAGKKLHEYPLYLRHGGEVILNRHWATIMDCIRWIITRPWWSRVWTYQEVILPPRDSIVHTTRHSFAISRLLNGISKLLDQYFKDFKRAIKYNYFFWASYQLFPFTQFIRVDSLHKERLTFLQDAGTNRQGLSLRQILHSTQNRRASDVRDHFHGVFGVLPVSLQKWWSGLAEKGLLQNAAQIFAQCTKVILSNYEPPTLDALSEAVGMRRTGIQNLPTWALDLSAPLPETEERDGRWRLYDACLGAEFQPVKKPAAFLSKELHVQGIRIGAVRISTRCHVEDSLDNTNDLLELVDEWRQIYREATRYPSDAKFWRAALMDRDIWRHWQHQRKPLYNKRIADISAWWNNVCETGGDYLDLVIDKSYNDGRRGDYHFRALMMNAQAQRFFVTQRYEPGLGPHLLQPGDEIYLLKGSNAPAMLRRVRGRADSAETFNFVGSCFVDGHMYGESLKDHPQWRELVLL